MNSERKPSHSSSPGDEAASHSHSNDGPQASQDGPEPSRKIPPDRQVESPAMKWNINWGLVIATVTLMLTIWGSAISVRVDIAKLQEGQDDLQEDVSGLKNDVSGLKTDVSGLKTDFSRLEVRFDGLEMRYDNLERRFNGLYNYLLNRSNAPRPPAAEAGRTAKAEAEQAAAAAAAAASQADAASRAPAGKATPAKSTPQPD